MPGQKRLYLGVQSVNVYVRDQDRSLQFYLDQLGFRLAFDAKLQSGDRWVAVSPPDGTAILALIAPRPNSPEYKLIGRATHVSFVTEDVTAKFLEWSKRGVRFHSTPRLKRLKYATKPPVQPSAGQSILGEQNPIWGGVFARFRDVDGNSFSLVSFDEFTHHLESQRRAEAERQEHERRAAQELEIAKHVQARLFPQTQPQLRTLDYAGVCIQARQVGGDYYDFLNLGEERLGLVLGDVSGKGIAAALLMANLQANLRSQVGLAVDPERLLRSVNQLFCDNTDDGAFASLFFAQYDDRAARLRYVNCGHLCALLLRADDSVDRLDATSTLLGLFKDWDCSVGERQLFSGDMLALYTDGITESFNQADDEQFGEQRLIDALLRHRSQCPQAVMDAIVGEVREFSPGEQHDDITLIIAKCTTKEEPNLFALR